MAEAFAVRGKACVVNGAYRGLGSVIARRLADHGAHVVLGDVRDCADLATETGRVSVRRDVTDEDQVEDLSGSMPLWYGLPEADDAIASVVGHLREAFC